MFQQSIVLDPALKVAPLALTVVIPTFNEAGNIEPLLERIGIALMGVEWEAIFVDDGSSDGTLELVTEIAQRAFDHR